MQNNQIIIDEPNDKQKLFFKAKSRFVAYGGARGGGKSWAVRKKATLLCLNYPGIRILLLRRTFPELRENHILPLQGELFGVAQYKETDKAFLFPNGARLRFGYCDSENDVLQYQGQEFDIIFMDEATQFTEYQYTTLTACLRGANSLPKRFYLTCNPGGMGHEWVKRLFISKEYRDGEHSKDYSFIAASVYDNKALLEQDEGYINMLKALPEDLRRSWLDGDWDALAGQYFKEFRRDIHVTEPIEIKPYWDRYFTMDYGLDMLAGLWIAVDENMRAYVYREVYEPDLIISKAAERILELSDGENIKQYYAPPDLWNRRQETGKSAADIFMDNGVFLSKSSNDRVDGWFSIHEWLKVYGDEQKIESADLKIFENCRNLIRTLPALQRDQKNVNDCAKESHELTHAPDALRGFCVQHQKAAEIPKQKEYHFFSPKPNTDRIGKERVVPL